MPVVGAFILHSLRALCAPGLVPAGDILYARDFVFCAVMTVFLTLWTRSISSLSHGPRRLLIS